MAGPLDVPLALLARVSTAPPPSELRALLDSVGSGRPLNLYLRC